MSGVERSGSSRFTSTLEVRSSAVSVSSLLIQKMRFSGGTLRTVRDTESTLRCCRGRLRHALRGR